MNPINSSVSLRVVFMGTPHFSVGILSAIQAAGIQLVGIVTVADKPAGRGMQLQESPVKQFATKHSIPVLQPEKLKDEDFLVQLRNWNADLFVVVAFRMLPVEVWKMPRFGTFNLHASLLPDYRGAAPINWTIINGDKKTGLSTFFIDEAIDTGNVIQQLEMSIGDNESAGELHDRMMDLGGKLVVDSIEKIAHGMVKTIPQSELSNSPVRPAPKLTKQNTQIDWSQDATSIHNLIRGLNPYPCAWTVWENLKGEIKNVKIQQTIVTEREGTGSLAITSDKHGVYIDTIGNVLELVSFQLEGKKKMTSKEWLAGNKATDWCVQSNEN